MSIIPRKMDVTLERIEAGRKWLPRNRAGVYCDFVDTSGRKERAPEQLAGLRPMHKDDRGVASQLLLQRKS
jgi:flagellar biosynthesis GTPase FlhF